MKLFLASSGDKTLQMLASLAGIDPAETKVAFIENAADPYTGDKQWGDKKWVKDDRKKLEELGYGVFDTDLEKFDAESFKKAMADFDMIHVCGGNTLYLLNLLRKKDLVGPLCDLVRSGKIYSGTSAGSMIAAPSAELEKYSEETKAETLAELKDFSGLGLVDFLIMPHANNKDFGSDYVSYIGHLPEFKDPLLFLYDDQAVWMDGGSMKIVKAV